MPRIRTLLREPIGWGLWAFQMVGYHGSSTLYLFPFDTPCTNDGLNLPTPEHRSYTTRILAV